MFKGTSAVVVRRVGIELTTTMSDTRVSLSLYSQMLYDFILICYFAQFRSVMTLMNATNPTMAAALKTHNVTTLW